MEVFLIKYNILTELKKIYGNDATFRPLQKEVIESILSGKNTLAVLGTGAGKSLTYFLASKILRNNGYGPTIVITPTISLMRDQVHNFNRFGKAVTINSSAECDKKDAYNSIKNNEVDIIFVSPETAISNNFINRMNNTHIVPLLVIDEAHSISLYSSDFRPDYGKINEIINRLSGTPTILGTTATATERVINDLHSKIPDLNIFRGCLDRPNFNINTYQMFNNAEKKTWIKNNLPNLITQYGKGIIYCSTIDYVNTVADFINNVIGINAIEYTSKTTNNKDREDDFRNGKIDCLVATEAFGVGVDIPDIGYILQYQPPLSIESYFQQIGRGGRDISKIPKMKALTFYSEEDKNIIDNFIKNTCPSVSTVEKILSLVSKKGCCDLQEILAILNKKEREKEKFERTIKFLISNSYLQNNEQLFILGETSDIYNDEKRIQIINQNELEFQKLFKILFSNNTCIMQQIRIALGDPTPNIQPCGRCSVCKKNNS